MIHLRRMASALAIFRELDPDVPSATIQVFILVATNPGISSKQVLQRIGLSQSAISRHLTALGEYSWRGGPGLDLIELVEDPMDRRSKLAFLKPRGKQLALRLITILSPESPEPDPADFPTASEFVRNVRRYGAR